MRRLLALALLLTTIAFTAPLRAQQMLIIQPSTVAGIVATTVTRNVIGALPVTNYGGIEVLVNITAGGTATGTLQLFLEDSPDGGVTWDDLVSSNTFAFGAAAITQRFFISATLIPSVITVATATNLTQGSVAAVETLTAGSARQGPYGDRIRVREKVSGPSGSPVGPTYTITAAFK